MIETTYEKLSSEQKELVDSAEAAMETAYIPYSHFHVGAALRTTDDKIITGSNIENAAFGCVICAERSAIARANAKGIRIFIQAAVIGKGEDFESQEVIVPCGICRQMLFEASQLGEKDIEILMSNTKKDKIIISTIGELLPLAFGPRDMDVDLRDFS